MIRASIGFSVMALCVKLTSQTIPSGEIVFFRSLAGSLMVGGLMWSRKVSFLGRNRGLMMLRAVSGFAALSLHFYTIARLPLGLAVMLNYTSPVFTALFAVFLLNEKPGLLRSILIAVSFVGIYLLTGADVQGPIGLIGLGLLSAVLTGVVFITIRGMKRQESPLTIIFYFTVVSTLGSIAFLPAGFRWPGLWEWFLLGGVAVGSFYGQLWMTLALRRAPASIVTPFSYLTPVLSFVYGLVFFGDRLEPLPLFGAFLIILGGTLILLFERPQAHSALPFSKVQWQDKASSPKAP